MTSIKNIESEIPKFGENHRKLGEFTKYNSKLKLMKYSERGSGNGSTQLSKEEMDKLGEIFNTHKEYEESLTECYSDIKDKLNEFEEYLKTIKSPFNNVGKTIVHRPSESGSTIIDPVLDPLEHFNSNVNRFDGYMESVKKLEEIGNHIKTMKSALDSVNDKVVEGAARYINGLANITIKKEDVQKIKNIKSVNESVIARLKIARHTIDFYQKLKDQISKLNVDFNDYDFTQYRTVKQKVKSFDEAIKRAINKIESDMKEINIDNHTIVVQGDTYDESFYKKLTSPVETFIDNSLNDIDQIKGLLRIIQYRKNQSENYINDIKSNVSGITKLEGATKTLTEQVAKLKDFVKFQEDTKSLIDTFKGHYKFTSLSGYSNTLDDIIDYSRMVIGHINHYIGYLKTVGYSNYLIGWMKKYYNSRFETIRGIIDKFKLYVLEIIGRVESINSNLSRLKWFQCGIFVQNLWRLKRYMKYLDIYITNIRENFDVISAFIDKIKKESSYFGIYKRKLESLEKFIDCYIKCYINKDGPEKGVKEHLEKIRERLNEILRVKHIILNCLNMTRIDKIESRLKSVESSVNQLECAIEGVARNFIRCSLQSLSNNTTVRIINYNNHNINSIYKNI